MGENGMYRILVCDDERDIVSALRIYLTAEGYEVLEAYNGSEMLRLAATQELVDNTIDRRRCISSCST